MKKLKVLAAAVAMALGAQAHASVTPVSNEATGSSLMLFVWNGTTSYARNLGLTLADVLNGTPGTVDTSTAPNSNWTTSGFTFSNPGTSLFTTTFGATPSITGWNIAAGDGTPLPQQFVTTINGTPPNVTLSGVGTVVTKIGSFFNVTGGLSGNPSTACTTGNECTFISSDNGYAGNSANWNNNFGTTSFPGNNAGTDTSSSLTFEYYRAATTGLSAAPKTLYANNTDTGHWTLANDGTVTYAIGAALVPLPGAIWLFGSGLLGFLAVGRRRKNSLV